jgi:hypothetical protein
VTTLQVDQATHTEAFAEFAQLCAAGREESAQQPIPAKLLDPDLPTLGATAQPLENPGELCREWFPTTGNQFLRDHIAPSGKRRILLVNERGVLRGLPGLDLGPVDKTQKIAGVEVTKPCTSSAAETAPQRRFTIGVPSSKDSTRSG